MTEKDWLACEDSLPMLRHLGKKASGRKLGLFAAACCRDLFPLLADERSRQAVEVAERYADRQAKRTELRNAEQVAREAAHQAFTLRGDNYAELAATETAAYTAFKAAYEASYFSQTVRRFESDIPGGSWVEASRPHARLVREIFGNPFRPATIDGNWLGRNGGAVRHLAASAYEERLLPSGHLDPAGLAILSDALEEAGCCDDEILGHLRGPGPHVRGCHLVDALLVRE